ncbi:MAG: DUF3592 domain-containing protein [Lachnospiraceae bacterium]|nr:DUF3592 domain-containing protein [Lachnospiraceae bacterium]
MSIGGSISIICGIVLLGIGILLFVLRKLTWKCTAQTEGRVIDMCMNAFAYNKGYSGKATFGVQNGTGRTKSRSPIYSYYVNGREYRRASNVAYNGSYVYSMMKKPVVVYYNPEKPEQSCLGKMGAMTFIGIVFSGLGVLFLFMGIVFMVIGI